MTISETQLETWAHQGAAVTAQQTHESVRLALSQVGDLVLDRDYEVYLQGSYKNYTNIRADSDVDIVVQLNRTFRFNISGLPASEQEAIGRAYSAATYTFPQFYADVLAALNAYYEARTIRGNKSITIPAQSGRLDADVVPCLQYRKYVYFHALGDERYIEGISLDTQREASEIISFPKSHYDNGARKNDNTNGYYKPAVRLFKNARTSLIDSQRILPDLSPSYFLECLIYNVPDDKFGTDFSNTYCNVVNWLNTANFDGFLCQDGQTQLFGNAPEQWPTEKARQFVNALITLWNDWR
jgi:hypothetical protein